MMLFSSSAMSQMSKNCRVAIVISYALWAVAHGLVISTWFQFTFKHHEMPYRDVAEVAPIAWVHLGVDVLCVSRLAMLYLGTQAKILMSFQSATMLVFGVLLWLAWAFRETFSGPGLIDVAHHLWIAAVIVCVFIKPVDNKINQEFGPEAG